jgi:hypothetical protein
MGVDELTVEDSRLLSFNSEPETDNPKPLAYSSLAVSGEIRR